MALNLTTVSYSFEDDEGTVLASVEYNAENDTVKVIKGANIETLTIPSVHIDTLRLLLKEVKARITEITE